MEFVSYRFEKEVLIVALHGRVDSANGPEVEEAINKAKAEFAPEVKNIVLDMDELEYISSFGLRIILKQRKEFKDIRVINVSAEVYEILDMTGFAEMMTVEKAYRKVSIENCEIIGSGSNGEVYQYDRDTIIKVYRNSDALPEIKRERELARKALVLGIPTAIPYDVVKVGNSFGSVFEMLNAKSFSKIVANEPEKLEETVKMYVDLLKLIHSTTVKPEDMPSMKDVALKWAEDVRLMLPEDAGKKLYDMVAAVPNDMHMMHGDYHMKNVMLLDGEPLLIDMDTISYGNPIFEFGSIFNAYKGFSELDHEVVKNFIGIDYETAAKIWDKTLELYFGTTDKAKLTEVENKAKIIGYMRLLRRTFKRREKIADSENLIKIYQQKIIDLLSSVENLIL